VKILFSPALLRCELRYRHLVVLVTTFNFCVQKNIADKNVMISLYIYDMFRPILFGHHQAVVQFTHKKMSSLGAL